MNSSGLSYLDLRSELSRRLVMYTYSFRSEHVETSRRWCQVHNTEKLQGSRGDRNESLSCRYARNFLGFEPLVSSGIIPEDQLLLSLGTRAPVVASVPAASYTVLQNAKRKHASFCMVTSKSTTPCI